MDGDLPDSPVIERDGTSQAGRVQPALDPEYVSVDERSAYDLLVLAQGYARELRFVNDRNQPDGDWTGFLGQRPEDLTELAALVEAVEPSGQRDALRVDRPHLALFLAFLRLLRHPRGLVNTLTRRHLSLYYDQLLRMSRKPAVPDHVHVLVKLAAGAERARLPQGTALRAGKDSLGRELFYRTDRELIVSRARLARLSSVYAQKEIVGLREARELHKGTREEAVLRMLEIALGDPHPGDPLPKYGGHDVTYALLLEHKQRVEFAAASLVMDFSDLHSMMQLERQRAAADAEWQTINLILEKAGRARTGDPAFSLGPTDPREFSTNLARALGGAPDFQRDGLPDVASLTELYEQRIREDVRAYIRDKLRLSEDDFYTMMRIKIRIDNEWEEINRILEQAGRRKRDNPAYRLNPARPTDFAANLQAAVGPIPFQTLAHAILPPIADHEAYYDAILALEAYFHINAAQLGYILAAIDKPAPGASDREWNNVYRLLSDAHRDKVYADRRRALRIAREAAPDLAAGFAAVLRIALGKDPDDRNAPALSDLRDHVAPAADYAFLASIQARLSQPSGGAITADDWARVYQVVELAQRVRERLPEPVAQRETWLDLHAAADATAVVPRIADPGAPQQRWKTFGQDPPAARPDQPPPPVIGWAISSPLLVLGQGTRTIVLTLGLVARQFDAGRISALFAGAGDAPFEIQLSTVTGWRPVPAAAAVGDYRTLTQVTRAVPAPLSALQLTLVLGDDVPAVVPVRDPASPAGWPVLRIMLHRIWNAQRGQYVSHYEPFRDLVLAAVHLQVGVAGLVPSAIQNDDAVLSARRPFEPFGASPAVGSRFTLGDPELVIKRLDDLTFHVDWRGAPADLAQHYAHYPDVGPFTTRIELVDNHLHLPLTGAPVDLFTRPDATRPHDIAIRGIPAIVERGGYRYAPADPPASAAVSDWPRYFAWELTPNDFKHQAFPAVAAQQALQLTADLLKKTGDINPTSYQVKPPYTPKIKSLTIDYSSRTEIVVPDPSAAAADQLSHVHPFGACSIAAEPEPGGARLLPRYDHEGELYLGIQGARPPETLALLFQMAEGSADPDLSPVPIEWSYLSGDRWLSLHDGHLLLDTSNGLIDSGIVELALPPAAPSTRLPGELYWLRAAIADRANSVCDTVAVHPQAVSARFADQGNAPDHFAQKLAERSITSLVQRIPQIAGVEQPYPSRGGRAAEAERGFYTRVSERLRHKQRALTTWDYERLVLERFPELYKVKCIPADATQDPERLGAVDLIVIPEIRGHSIANPFEPKAPAALIAAIEAYLADKRPPQAAVRVRNARFVQVKVRVGVRFRTGGDDGFYQSLLNEELNRFLSPWAYDDGADIVIGGKIFANSIVGFIDGRDYVDYVAKIELFSIDDGRVTQAQPVPGQGTFVTTDRPDGVLVAARQHEIDVIPEAGYAAVSFTGINYMKIELDFVVAGSP